MKVDHAPDTAPQRSLSDKVGEALVHTVEFLVPPLKRSLAWDRSEFEPMFPDWYMNAHPKQQPQQTSTSASAKTNVEASRTSATPDVSFGQQHVASSAA